MIKIILLRTNILYIVSLKSIAIVEKYDCHVQLLGKAWTWSLRHIDTV